MKRDNFIEVFEESIICNWDSVAIFEISTRKETKYCEIATEVVVLHYIWKALGLKKGDKIAIVADNCSEWIEIFLAVISGGYITVILPNNLSREQICKFVAHSECKLVYTDNPTILIDNTTNITVINIQSGSIIYDNANISRVYNHAFEYANNQLRVSVSPSSIKWEELNPNDIESIVYTSGTSNEPKAVLHSINFATASLNMILNKFNNKKGDNEVCILPFSHVFGIIADVMASLCSGMRIIIVNDITPNSIYSALTEYKPRKFFAPPLLLSKMVEAFLEDGVNNKNLENESFCNVLRAKLIDFFGGNLEAFVTGGASLTQDLEKLLITKIHFPLITLYGSTECGLVSISNFEKCLLGSAGEIVNKNDVRINLSAPSYNKSNIGEIQIRGNICSGYYKNIKATNAAFTDDGWFKTGDLGYIDENGYLFITGRCKDMLLTSNGENIYPEEIEETMNASPYIKESILVQRGEKLYAIVVPDRKKAEEDNLDVEALEKKIDQAVREASKKLPGFTIISGFELRDEPLERTPKGSLKRYLYSDGIKEN